MLVDYSFGGAGGMTISLHPKSRASSEKAPGPRKAITTEIATNSSSASYESNRFQAGTGNHERKTPRDARPAIGLASGLRNPIRIAAPLIRNSTPKTGALELAFPRTPKNATPCVAAIRPRVIRKSSNPTPGKPPGNAENNLNSLALPGPPQRSDRTNVPCGAMGSKPKFAVFWANAFEV